MYYRGNANTFDSFFLPYVVLNSAPGNTSTAIDHDLSYTWCVPIKTAGTHRFNLFLGSFTNGTTSESFLEGGMVNIELVNLPSASACTAAPNL